MSVRAPQLHLTRPERKAIMRGSRKPLRRQRKPAVSEGDHLVLSRTRGGRVVVDRETGETAERVSKPTVWLRLSEPRLVGGEWEISFVLHDERETRRLLASGVPGTGREPGLKTRQRPPEQVPKRGEQVGSFTEETERGYTSHAGSSMDPGGESVGNDTLVEFAVRARARHSEAQRELAQENAEIAEEARRRRERAIRDRLREVQRGLSPVAQEALLARIEREIEAAQREDGEREAA